MPKPHELLAESLAVLKKLTEDRNQVAFKTGEISRTHRERLLQNGFIKEVTKGWYIGIDPNERPGDTTSWYLAYWRFCSEYLQEKYANNYCLSAEQSLQIHAGNSVIPKQLIIRSPDASNSTIELLNDTSLYLLKSSLPSTAQVVEKDGIRILSLPWALINSSPVMYEKSATDMRTALSLVDDASEILNILLEGSNTTIAGRLAGGFRNIGQDRIADQIMRTMIAAGFAVREEDLFKQQSPFSLTSSQSPFEARIRLMWEGMRNDVIAIFPPAPGIPPDLDRYLQSIDEIYVTDAYHSLSIERYVVSAGLIEKVRSGEWDIDTEEGKKQRDALAARGYWLAAQEVKQSINKVLAGRNSGDIFDQDHSEWYLQLFAPSVNAGLLKVTDLAGYRTNPVYISNSLHVPMSKDSVRQAMPILSELLKSEKNAGVRAVLGHFIFVFIHPYMDGNGRMGRFLMNLMLASGGYPWTVIPVEERSTYMQSLEQASVYGNIKPFSEFLSYLVTESLKGTPVAQLISKAHDNP